MKKSKKFIALTLAVTLLISMTNVFGFTASASTAANEDYTYTISTNEDGTSEATITKCPSNLSGIVTVPTHFEGAPVTAIGQEAFLGCNVQQIILPDTICEIGKSAFQSSSVREINIPNEVTTLKAGTFQGCSKLTTIHWSNKLEVLENNDNIYNGVFQGCSSLTNLTFPSSLKTIGIQAFAFCNGLQEVNLNNVETIRSSAFGYVGGLFKIKQANALKLIESNAFQHSSLQEIDLQNVPEQNGLQIKSAAFTFCKNLKSINIPKGVTQIEPATFEQCGALESVTLPSTVKKLMGGSTSAGIFTGCTKLTTITLPEGMEEIQPYAFRNAKLQTIVLPNSLTSIGEYAFTGCDKLQQISIPDSITVLNTGTFYNCTNLAQIKLPNGITTIKACTFYNCTSLEAIALPDSVTTIENANMYSQGAFRKCTSLKDIIFSNNLRVIGTYAFAECDALTSVVTPMSVSNINDYAFYNCSNLSYVNILNKNATVATSAFLDCNATVSFPTPYINVSLLKKLAATTGDSSTYTVNENLNQYNITAYNVTKNQEITGVEKGKMVSQLMLPMNSVSAGDQIRLTFESKDGSTLTKTVVTQLDEQKNSNLEVTVLEKGYILVDYTQEEISKTPVQIALYDQQGNFLKKISLKNGAINSGYLTAGNYNILVVKTNVMCWNLDTLEDYQNRGLVEGQDYYVRAVQASDNVQSRINVTNLKACDDSKLSYFNQNDTCFITNTSQITVDGYIEYNIKYSIKDQYNVSDSKINISFPDNVVFVPGSLSIDKELQPTTIVPSNNILCVPVTGKSGSISFSAKPTENGDCAVTAAMSFKINGIEKVEKIGTASVSVPFLTLTCSSTVNVPTLKVSGIAPAHSQIKIYDGDQLLTTVQASNSGKYTALVEFNNPVNRSSHIISAQCDELFSNKVKVQYNQEKPKLEKVTFGYPGRTPLDITDAFLNGASPVVTLLPWFTYSFELTVSNSDLIESIQVISDQNGLQKALSAIRVEGTNRWVTNGYFDPANTDFFAGRLIIRCKYKENVRIPTILVSDDEINKCLDDAFEGSSQVVLENSENSLILETLLKNGLKVRSTYKSGESFNYTAENESTIQITPSTTTAQFIQLGFTANEEENYFYKSVGNSGGGDTLIEFVKDDNKIYSAVVEITDIEYVNGTSPFAKKARGSASYATKVGSIVMQEGAVGQKYKDIEQKANEAKETINSLNLPQNRKNSYIQQIDFEKELAKLEVGGAIGASIATRGGSIVPGPTLSYVFSGHRKELFEVFNKAMDNLDEAIDDEVEKAKKEEEQGSGGGSQDKDDFGRSHDNLGEGEVKPVRDPSGYIYEAVPENRLKDVTVSIYYKKNLNSEPVLWDAGEYDQINPLTTGNDGGYAWDVPEGYWQVKAEKTGYQTVYSDWMEVPPPRTGVNLAMVNTAAPVVQYLMANANDIELVFDKYMDLSTITNQSVTVMQGSSSVPVTISPVLSDDPDSQQYAKKFIIRPVSGSFGQNQDVTVTVSKAAKSYAGTNVGSAISQSVVVNKKIESMVCADAVEMHNNTTKNLPVVVTPGNASAGKKILITNSGSETITTPTEVTIDNNGCALIPLTSVEVGMVVLTLQVENTDITREVVVNSTPAPIADDAVISCDKQVVELKPENEYTLPVSVVPQTAQLTWGTSNADVVTVENGVLHGVSSGTAVITIACGTVTKQIFVQVGIANNIQSEFTLMQINKYQYVSNRFTETEFVGYDTTCPIVINGKTFLPVRLGGMSTGCTNIEYNEATQGITMTNQFGTQIQLYTDSNIAKKVYLNGVTETFQMSANVVNIGGRTYLPVRELAALAGYGIEYIDDGSGAFVIINNYNASLQECANIVAQYKDRITY